MITYWAVFDLNFVVWAIVTVARVFLFQTVKKCDILVVSMLGKKMSYHVVLVEHCHILTCKTN